MRNIIRKRTTYRFNKKRRLNKFHYHALRVSGRIKSNKNLPHGGNRGAANIRMYYRSLKVPELTLKEIKEFNARKVSKKKLHKKLKKLRRVFNSDKFPFSKKYIKRRIKKHFDNKLLSEHNVKFDNNHNLIYTSMGSGLKETGRAHMLGHLYPKAAYNVNKVKAEAEEEEEEEESQPFFHIFANKSLELKLRRLTSFALKSFFYLKNKTFKNIKKLTYRRWLGRGIYRRPLHSKHTKYYLRRAFRRMDIRGSNFGFGKNKKGFLALSRALKYLKSEHIKTLILKTFFGKKRFKRTSWGRLERFLKFEIYKPYRSNKLKPTDKDHLRYFINLQHQLHKFLFGGFTFKKLWKISRKLRKKGKPITSENLFANFQCRLDALVQNLGFAFTIGAARNIIKNKVMVLNGRQTSHIAYVVKPNDVFGFLPKYRDKFRKEYLYRISRMRTNNVLLNNVPYIEKNYLLMLFTYISNKFNENFIALPPGFKRSLLFGLGFRKV